MLAEASIPTAHGSSHGLVPHVQYSEHYASPDIHTIITVPHPPSLHLEDPWLPIRISSLAHTGRAH